MDTTAPNTDMTDVVLDQLKKLREGVGLTRDRLEAAGAVMSALGTSDPDEAYERLLQILCTLDDEAQAVLETDFGLHLAQHLRTEPSSGERRFLGHRRNAYSLVTARDPKTLARRSNAAVADLRTRLLNDTYTGDLHVIVAVRGQRTVGVTLVQNLPADPKTPEILERRSFDYPNPSRENSPPVFLYAFPRDWQPASLTLTVTFLGDELPIEVYGFCAPNFIEAAFAQKRYPLNIVEGAASCRFERPGRGQLYGAWWRYHPHGASPGP